MLQRAGKHCGRQRFRFSPSLFASSTRPASSSCINFPHIAVLEQLCSWHASVRVVLVASTSKAPQHPNMRACLFLAPGSRLLPVPLVPLPAQQQLRSSSRSVRVACMPALRSRRAVQACAQAAPSDEGDVLFEEITDERQRQQFERVAASLAATAKSMPNYVEDEEGEEAGKGGRAACAWRRGWGAAHARPGAWRSALGCRPAQRPACRNTPARGPTRAPAHAGLLPFGSSPAQQRAHQQRADAERRGASAPSTSTNDGTGTAPLLMSALAGARSRRLPLHCLPKVRACMRRVDACAHCPPLSTCAGQPNTPRHCCAPSGCSLCAPALPRLPPPHPHVAVHAAHAQVAIVGRPNVGKSALFNRIAGARLAVVFDQPGITRDRLYTRAAWGKAEFVMVDTGACVCVCDGGGGRGRPGAAWWAGVGGRVVGVGAVGVGARACAPAARLRVRACAALCCGHPWPGLPRPPPPTAAAATAAPYAVCAQAA